MENEVSFDVSVRRRHVPLLLFFLTSALDAQRAAAVVTRGSLNVDDRGVMLKGHDPVSYFEIGGHPLVGEESITATHGGATYCFATESNRALFEAAPQRYMPQYGGFCSYGVRMGQKLDIAPDAYRIVDGRLFLQLDLGTRFVWMLDERNNIAIADKIWPKLRFEHQSVR